MHLNPIATYLLLTYTYIGSINIRVSQSLQRAAATITIDDEKANLFTVQETHLEPSHFS